MGLDFVEYFIISDPYLTRSNDVVTLKVTAAIVDRLLTLALEGEAELVNRHGISAYNRAVTNCSDLLSELKLMIGG